MATPGIDAPAPPPPSLNWQRVTLGLGLVCLFGGLFLAAGFKDALWPKVVTVAGVVAMIISGLASAVASLRQRFGRK
jgi:hypothetical protein